MGIWKNLVDTFINQCIIKAYLTTRPFIMTKKELVQILNKLDDDDKVFIHVAYNTYDIRQVINWGDFAVLNAGATVNPEPYHLDDTA